MTLIVNADGTLERAPDTLAVAAPAATAADTPYPLTLGSVTLADAQHFHQHPGACPRCRSEDHTSWAPLDGHEHYVDQHGHCHQCGISWREIYTFSGLLNEATSRTTGELATSELSAAAHELLDQLHGIGIPHWHGAEGLDLERLTRALEQHRALQSDA